MRGAVRQKTHNTDRPCRRMPPCPTQSCPCPLPTPSKPKCKQTNCPKMQACQTIGDRDMVKRHRYCMPCSARVSPAKSAASAPCACQGMQKCAMVKQAGAESCPVHPKPTKSFLCPLSPVGRCFHKMPCPCLHPSCHKCLMSCREKQVCMVAEVERQG